jgi:hypothetical protein
VRITLYSACGALHALERRSSRSATARTSSGSSALVEALELLRACRRLRLLAELLLDRAQLLAQQASRWDLLLGVEAEGGGDAVGEQAGLVGATEHLDPLTEAGDHVRGDLLQLFADLGAERLGEQTRLGRVVDEVREDLAVDGPVGLRVQQSAELEAPQPLEHDLIVAVACAPDLTDAGVGADGLEIGELGVDDPGVALDGDADDRLAGLERLDQGDRAGAADGDGDDRPREEDAVAQGQQRERGLGAVRGASWWFLAPRRRACRGLASVSPPPCRARTGCGGTKKPKTIPRCVNR